MPEIGLIITLGSRDIQIENQLVNILKKEAPDAINEYNTPIPRLLGKYLIDDDFLKYNLYKGLVTYPLVREAIKFIESDLGGAKLTYLVLVATDQGEEVKPKFRNRDTVHYATLFEHIYKGKYPSIVSELISGEIIFIDDMFHKFEKLVDGNSFKPLDNCEYVYLCNQAGVDAINTGLMLNAILKYEDKLKLISIDESTAQVHLLRVPKQFRALFERKEAIKLIDRFEYHAIEQFKELPKEILLMSQYAFYRLNFNFDKAKQQVRQIEDYAMSKTEKSKWIAQLDVYEAGKDQNNSEKLKELYYNACILFEKGAYVDFLLRSFRISEGVSRNWAMECIKAKERNIKESSFKDAVKILEQHEPQLVKFLDNYQINPGHKLDYRERNQLNIPTCVAIIEYYHSKDDPKIKCIKGIEALSQLRNKSIGAHGFSPVSLEKIEKEVLSQGFKNIGSFFEKLKDLVGAQQNPFDQINQWLKDRIEKADFLK